MTVTQTSRLHLTRYGADSDLWAPSDMRGNVDELENRAAVGISGTLAARPAAGVRDRYYWATDKKRLYYDDSTRWYVVADSGPRTTYTPTLTTNDAAFTITAGVGAGRYRHVGMECTFSATITLNAAPPSGGLGAVGFYGVDLPVAAGGSGGDPDMLVHAQAFDTSSGNIFNGIGIIHPTQSIVSRLRFIDPAGGDPDENYTHRANHLQPFVWDSGDVLTLHGSYETGTAA